MPKRTANATKIGRPRWLDVAQIRLDGDTQIRGGIDDQAVADYADAIGRGDRLPAVIVFFDKHDYWLADGFHRIAAVRRAGETRISAQVVNGTRADAAWYAIGANRTNGLRMTNADKERAVKRALEMRPQMSNRAIAEYVGVSHHTVEKYRSETAPRGQIAHVERSRQGRDGKQYAVAQPPAHSYSYDDPPPSLDAVPAAEKYCAPPTDEPPPVPEPPPAPEPPPESPPELPPEPPAAGAVDRVGCPITDPRIAEAFRRDVELVELCTQVSRLKVAVGERLDQQDPLYADIVPTQWEVNCSALRALLSHARPYAVCPYCRGSGRECKACHTRGWVNKTTYETAPREMK